VALTAHGDVDGVATYPFSLDNVAEGTNKHNCKDDPTAGPDQGIHQAGEHDGRNGFQ